MLRANEAYWGGRPAVDEVVFVAYRDPGKMADDLESGALDAAVGLEGGRFRQLRRDDRLQAIAAPGRSFVDLGFVCAPTATDANPVLRDQAFRQALNWAIDRRTIVARLYDGLRVGGQHHRRPRCPPRPRLSPRADAGRSLRLRPQEGRPAAAGRRLRQDGAAAHRPRQRARSAPPVRVGLAATGQGDCADRRQGTPRSRHHRRPIRPCRRTRCALVWR